ncbi:hypothetical protein B296_00026625 [Ensete ventricosum]|uniref:Uncharacterized protein n=1 Tax=Ensete ventricosum TaxID=4639 RepID=A0A427AA94_ENSVE|nr:hypothetical protein B296_00026625 [Ensete ventricosum]
MKSDGGAGSGSAASTPTTGDAGVSIAEKRPSSRVGAGLRKCLRKVATEQPADSSGSTARTSADKGKGIVELEEIPERGYTMRELCEVDDRAGADKYFASIMTQLKCVNSEDPLVSRWSIISGSSPFWTEGPLSREYLWGALRPILTNLDGARNDRARLESDVLLLTEVATFLEAELKAKSQKTMAAYKASRGFESSLEKMGSVSYEFRYRVASDFGGSTLILCSNRTPSLSVPKMPTLRWTSTSLSTTAPPLRSSRP